MVIRPPVQPLPEVLPFEELSFEQFEGFCRQLVDSLPWISSREEPLRAFVYGTQGDPQRGIDVFARDRAGKLWVFQCKRHKDFTPARVHQVVEKATYPADHYVLLLGSTATSRVRDAVGQHPGWELWDARDLSLTVIHKLPRQEVRSILHRFFGPSWADLLTPAERSRSGSQPAAFNLPAGTPFFTGRDALLEQLRSQLAVEAVAHPVALHGLGGIGKTQLALEYVSRHGSAHEQVFWVNGASRETLVADYVSLADWLELPVRDEADEWVIVEAVRRWLVDHPNWLLVLDNADDPGLIADLVPVPTGGRLLLTSRGRVFDRFGDTIPIEVGGLPPDEARRFMLKRIKRENIPGTEVKALDELIEEVRGLPLALEQAGAYILRANCNILSYLTSFRARRLELLERTPPAAGDYNHSVRTTWSLNIERVDARSPASTDIMRVSAFLAPDGIPDELLIEGREELGERLNAVLESVGTDPLAYDEVLAPLADYSLIRRNPSARTFDVHRLVQDVVRLGLDDREERVWAEAAVCAGVSAEPQLASSAWGRWDQFFPHLLSAIDHGLRLGISVRELGTALNDCGIYLHDRARFTEAEAMYTRALEVRERMMGISHRDVAQTLVNFALLDLATGALAGVEEKLERALTIFRREEEHSAVAHTLLALASLHHDRGNYAQAEREARRALEIWEKVDDVPAWQIAIALGNIGRYCLAQGNFAQAEEAQLRAIKILEAFADEYPELLGTQISNLGVIYSDQGRYEKAEAAHLRVIALNEGVLGEDHPDLATTLNNLAVVYWKMDRLADAARALERTLAIEEQHFGSNHLRLATTYNNLGLLADDQERFAEAERYYKRAIAIREEVFGSDHVELSIPLNNLGEVYRTQERLHEAEQLYLRSLKLVEKTHGPEHIELATTLNNLALVYGETNRYEEEESIHRRALAIREQALGPDHTDVAQSLKNLAECLRNQNRQAEALPFLERALSIEELAFGSSHHSLATTLNNLGSLYCELGRHHKGEEMLQRAFVVREQKYGRGHALVREVIFNLADCAEGRGDTDAAERLYREMVQRAERHRGTETLDAAHALTGLARLLHRVGRHAEAEPLFARSLTIRESILGPSHPAVARALRRYASVLHRIGRADEAAEMEQRADSIDASAVESR
ncbi:MAG TPA: tetratricopeptide repeat protein [Longimicrobium sp.]|nr:tetratricopeptide repeat protein [Longimicrobium sp.]